ncbi:hypothetical protein [Mycobacterium sp.]|uniref:hypothetical protein n=1 Tax=Mycobacterium sp. TaxID=1785 RepID=UPI003C77F56A
MRLAAWARSVGVHPQTAYGWVREDRMPVPFRRLPSGTILVDEQPVDDVGGDVGQPWRAKACV